VPFKPLALLFGLLAPLLEKLQHIRGKDDRFAGTKDLLQALLAKDDYMADPVQVEAVGGQITIVGKDGVLGFGVGFLSGLFSWKTGRLVTGQWSQGFKHGEAQLIQPIDHHIRLHERLAGVRLRHRYAVHACSLSGHDPIARVFNDHARHWLDAYALRRQEVDLRIGLASRDVFPAHDHLKVLY
jgi:hypothetical protein